MSNELLDKSGRRAVWIAAILIAAGLILFVANRIGIFDLI